MQFRKKPVVIEATQWFKNGDHPLDRCDKSTDAAPRDIEGQVVRYYRHPDVPGESLCEQCGKPHHVHGWTDTLEQGSAEPTTPVLMPLYTELLSKLPFALTSAQQRVCAEVAQDLARAVPMHRLLQGDVGAGRMGLRHPLSGELLVGGDGADGMEHRLQLLVPHRGRHG